MTIPRKDWLRFNYSSKKLIGSEWNFLLVVLLSCLFIFQLAVVYHASTENKHFTPIKFDRPTHAIHTSYIITDRNWPPFWSFVCKSIPAQYYLAFSGSAGPIDDKYGVSI